MNKKAIYNTSDIGYCEPEWNEVKKVEIKKIKPKENNEEDKKI